MAKKRANPQPKCACGHPKESHGEYTFNGAYRCRCFDCPVSESGEEYHSFRPELPWPDSEGLWWCSNPHEPEAIVVYAKLRRGEFTIFPLYDEYAYSESSKQQYQTARFTKLLEKNPFA